MGSERGDGDSARPLVLGICERRGGGGTRANSARTINAHQLARAILAVISCRPKIVLGGSFFTGGKPIEDSLSRLAYRGHEQSLRASLPNGSMRHPRRREHFLC